MCVIYVVSTVSYSLEIVLTSVLCRRTGLSNLNFLSQSSRIVRRDLLFPLSNITELMLEEEDNPHLCTLQSFESAYWETETRQNSLKPYGEYRLNVIHKYSQYS